MLGQLVKALCEAVTDLNAAEMSDTEPPPGLREHIDVLTAELDKVTIPSWSLLRDELAAGRYLRRSAAPQPGSLVLRRSGNSEGI